MKKLLSILLSVLLLTACGNTQTNTDIPTEVYNGPTSNFPITEEKAKEIQVITDGEYELTDYNSWEDNHRVIMLSDESNPDSPRIMVDIRGEDGEPIEYMAANIHYSLDVDNKINQEAADAFNEKAKEQLDDMLYDYYGYSDMVSHAWDAYNKFLDTAKSFEGVRIVFFQSYGHTVAEVIATREDTSSSFMLERFSLMTEEWKEKSDEININVLKSTEGYTKFKSVKEIKNFKAEEAVIGEAKLILDFNSIEYSTTMPQELAGGAHKNIPMGKDGYITATISDGKTDMKVFVAPELVDRYVREAVFQIAIIPAEQPVVAVLTAIS